MVFWLIGEDASGKTGGIFFSRNDSGHFATFNGTGWLHPVLLIPSRSNFVEEEYVQWNCFISSESVLQCLE